MEAWPSCATVLTDPHAIQCPACGTPLGNPTLAPGTRLAGGHYAVGQVLGQGGFGITYRGAVNMLHFDIKPDNIFLAQDGRVVLIDFGAAKDFQMGVSMQRSQTHTPGYAPPEQYAGRARCGPL